VDEYISLRKKQVETKEQVEIDPALENIVLGMFDRCFTDGVYKQALGIAIETRRLDKIEEAIKGNYN
jgi:26S proteasome regulatory subunit N2